MNCRYAHKHLVDLFSHLLQGSVSNDLSDLSALAEELHGRRVFYPKTFRQLQVRETREHVHFDEGYSVVERLGELLIDGLELLAVWARFDPEFNDDGFVGFFHRAFEGVSHDLDYLCHIRITVGSMLGVYE